MPNDKPLIKKLKAAERVLKCVTAEDCNGHKYDEDALDLLEDIETYARQILNTITDPIFL